MRKATTSGKRQKTYKKRGYRKISYQIKRKLVNLAAKRVKINYNTAKQVVSFYKNEQRLGKNQLSSENIFSSKILVIQESSMSNCTSLERNASQNRYESNEMHNQNIVRNLGNIPQASYETIKAKTVSLMPDKSFFNYN